MDFSAGYLLIIIIVSCVALVYYAYGKQNPYFKISAVLLFIYPYFLTNVWAVFFVGIILLALPFILNRFIPLD